jgi:16S rRNA (uracil1498-N3)-methyltransferase
MRLSRIYTDQPLAPLATIELSGQPAHYLSKVLRLDVGSSIILFNGDGYEYSGRIAGLTKKLIQIDILEQLASLIESPLSIVLGIGISRGERMDYAVQKSTELGVSAIVPLFTEHSEVKLKGDRLEKRRAHWQQVVISACEQSGRVLIPKVHLPLNLEAWLPKLDCEKRLLFDHRQPQRLDSKKPEGSVAVLIGPEGGFSEREVKEASNAGFTGVKLGSRVLRTETAPVAVLSVLQCLWGDFQG